MKKGKLLLIDYQNLLHRNIHAHKHLTYQGEFTGGVYGMLKMLTDAVQDYMPDRVLVCRDSPPYIRAKQYPEYKSGRHKGDRVEFDRKLHDTDAYMMRLFNLLNVPVWGVSGFEADDLIAYTVYKYRYRFRTILVLSNDGDLDQLCYAVGDSVDLRLRKNKGTVTAEKIREDFGAMSLPKFVTIHAVAGTHNAVEGVRGIGLKTAKKVLDDDEARADLMKLYSKTIRRNYKLIMLPHERLRPALERDQGKQLTLAGKPGTALTEQIRRADSLLVLLGIKGEKNKFLNTLSFQHLRL